MWPAMAEDALLRALPLAARLRITAVDLAVTGAPQAVVEAVWLAAGTQHQLDREEYVDTKWWRPTTALSQPGLCHAADTSRLCRCG